MVSKNLGGRLVAEAFSRGIMRHLAQARKLLLREDRQVDLAGQGLQLTWTMGVAVGGHNIRSAAP